VAFYKDFWHHLELHYEEFGEFVGSDFDVDLVKIGAEVLGDHQRNL